MATILDNVQKSIQVEIPEFDKLEEYLDDVLPKIQPWSETLEEKEHYLDVRWKEIRDDEQFLETILHIFRDNGEYLYSIDGNLNKGIWKILQKTNTFIIETVSGGQIVRSELFDLAFLNDEFFILKKHGDQHRKGQRKYLMFAREDVVDGMEWTEVTTLLYAIYKSNSNFYIIVVVLICIFIIAVFLFA
ncbi:MAG: hypothetical protein KBA06_06595 [Saprospiraceae bacterium]|nr:hypothetical protein [Saprospiraceae bacterium]